ncbi:MAG: T9SS type A sorting domain-containing protein [Flavobacteriales bacterium]
MQKALSVLVCSLLLSLQGQAQTVGPTPNPDANWLIYRIVWGNFHIIDPIGIVGDTLIDNQSYHRLMQSVDTLWTPVDATYRGALRVEDEKWYYRKAGGTEDAFICDFGLSLGDTVLINHEWSDGEVSLRVELIDTLVTNGVSRKRLHLNLVDGWWNPNSFDEVWIEGVGSTNGLYYSGYLVWDSGYLLSCYHEGDTLHYISQTSLEYSGECYVTTSVENHEQADFGLYPNPSDGLFTVEIGDWSGSSSLEVLNMLGETVAERSTIGSVERIDVSHLTPGVYMVRVRNGGNEKIRRLVLRK